KTRTALDQARSSLRQSRRQEADLTLQRGLSLCEQGETNRGMLWLARALEIAIQAEDADLERIIRLNLGGWHTRARALRSVWQPPSAVRAVAFSPDGKTVLIGNTNSNAQLWDLATATPVGPPLKHAGAVVAVAFSGDGKMVVTGSNDRTARAWNVATGQPL